MANGEEEKKLTAEEKGKGKAPAQDGVDDSNGASESSKDGKLGKDGKDADKPEEGMLAALKAILRLKSPMFADAY